MFVAAHPNDPEFLAGNTITRLVREGHEVTYVIVTNGNKESSDRNATPANVAQIHTNEQHRATTTLNIAHK